METCPQVYKNTENAPFTHTQHTRMHTCMHTNMQAHKLLCLQLARLVAENIVAIDKKFWLRVATRNDTASTNEEKERLQVTQLRLLMHVPCISCVSKPGWAV